MLTYGQRPGLPHRRMRDAPAKHAGTEGDRHWKKIEPYISQNSEATSTHALCPECVVRPEVQLTTRTGK